MEELQPNESNQAETIHRQIEKYKQLLALGERAISGEIELTVEEAPGLSEDVIEQERKLRTAARQQRFELFEEDTAAIEYLLIHGELPDSE